MRFVEQHGYQSAKRMMVYFVIAILISACGTKTTHDSKVSPPLPNETLGTIVDTIGTNPLVFFQDSKNNIWFGGKHLYKYDGETVIMYTTYDGLCGGGIIGMQEDSNGVLFIDTDEGVCKFDGAAFVTLPIIESNSPDAIWALGEEDLWFRGGWSRNGPLRYDGNSLFQLEFPDHPRADSFYQRFPNVPFSPYGIYTIYKDGRGHLWFGTAALGACRYDGGMFDWLYEEHLTNTPEGGSFGIRSIVEDTDGNYWICNTNFRYDIEPPIHGSTEVSYSRDDGIEPDELLGKSQYSMSSIVDNSGDMWFTTYDEGVWRKTEEEMTHFPLKRNGQQILAFAIAKDIQGEIWLMTHNAGVLRYQKGKFEPFRP